MKIKTKLILIFSVFFILIFSRSFLVDRKLKNLSVDITHGFNSSRKNLSNYHSLRYHTLQIWRLLTEISTLRRFEDTDKNFSQIKKHTESFRKNFNNLYNLAGSKKDSRTESFKGSSGNLQKKKNHDGDKKKFLASFEKFYTIGTQMAFSYTRKDFSKRRRAEN